MENPGSIIWLLIAVGAMIFSANSKARKKAQEAARKTLKEMQERGRREAWPSWDAPEHSTDHPAAETPAPQALQQAEYTDNTPSATVQTPRTIRQAPDCERLRQQLQTAPETPADTDPHTGSDPSGEAAADGIKNAFDVRSAILYSEILKPKFNEYE